MKQYRGALLLAFASFIWGTAFAFQRIGMEHIGPYTFTSIRSLVGAAVLVPVFRLQKGPDIPSPNPRKLLWIGGLCCGAVLTAAVNLQQVGMLYTTVGKAGFLTALYTVIVPLLGIFLKKTVSLQVWTSVMIAVVGAYLLSIQENFTISFGDLLEILCALCFSFHILLIDYFSPRVNCIALCSVQFLVAGLLTLPPALILEQPQLSELRGAAGSILYAGVLSSGVAYTLQIVAQKGTPPAVASLVMSLESVFAALAGWVLLSQAMSGREIAGCCLVFAAVVLAQLPLKSTGRNQSTS